LRAFSSMVGVRIRFTVWLVSGYAHVFTLLSIVIVNSNKGLWWQWRHCVHNSNCRHIGVRPILCGSSVMSLTCVRLHLIIHRSKYTVCENNQWHWDTCPQKCPPVHTPYLHKTSQKLLTLPKARDFVCVLLWNFSHNASWRLYDKLTNWNAPIFFTGKYWECLFLTPALLDTRQEQPLTQHQARAPYLFPSVCIFFKATKKFLGERRNISTSFFLQFS